MKYCFIVTLLLLTFTATQHQHSYRCLFDQLNVDLKEQSKHEKPDVPVHSQPKLAEGRLLQAPNPIRGAFRIQLDTTLFNDPIQPGQNGANSSTTTNLNFILKSMAVTQVFYQTRLQVGQTASISSPLFCVDFSPPSQAYANADLVIYVRYITDAAIAYGATGKSCKYYTGNSLPDLQLMQGRPTVGRIIFNTYNLVDQQSSLTNKVFQSLTSTALHETMHILGFDSTLYSTYLDPTTGNYYSSGPQILGTVNANRPTTKLMSTPYVLAWAKAFFGCNSMTGMPLENQDGTGLGSASHWERTAMYDELMTGTALGTAKYFSGLTFALLKDSGWYTVDDTFAGTSNFGYQKGCSFLTDACYGTTFSEFCTTAVYPSGNSYCASNFIGKATCSTDAALMADGCGMFGEYSSCIDTNTQPTSFHIYTFQTYGANSFCLDSTLGQGIVVDPILRSRCYPFVCNPNNITFTIGSYSITCLDTQGGVQKTLSGMNGYLICPIFTSFCTVSQKTCTNFCNQNGYCMGGVCNCNTGYSGKTCTQTICTAGQYYDPVGGTCGANCPSGYYTNKYSKSCEICQSPCSECSGTPTNCVGCQPVNGVTMYYYSSACYAQCPTSTYPLGNLTCADCDTAACLNCSGSPTACTACQSSLYLSPPTTGSCVASCSGSFPLHDVVHMKCVATCPSNLFTAANNSCIYCAGTTYLQAGSCVGTCATGSYPDATLKACMTCHIECNTCDGSYPQNCTSCKSASGNPYLLLKMCWAICPKGFYANPSTGKCEVCPVELRCTACTYNASNSSSYCTSCEYGTFYQASATACQTGCNANQYKNTWNNSCNGCDPACATCNGPTSFSCTSCPGTFYLLTNSTGGYCLTACPTQGYIQIGTTCQLCDPTCLTCNGVSANQCADCATNYYFYLGYCRYVCPNGTYANSTNWQCLTCDSTCSYCFGGTNASCTSCATGLYLYNYTCSNSCPNGMSPNQWNVCWEPSLLLPMVSLMLLLLVFMA